VFAPLVATVLWMGIYPSSFFAVMEPSVGALIKQYDTVRAAAIQDGTLSPTVHSPCSPGTWSRAAMNYMLALPEIFLAVAASPCSCSASSCAGDATNRIAWLSVLALIVTSVLLLWSPSAATQTAFQSLYVVDQFAVFLKVSC